MDFYNQYKELFQVSNPQQVQSSQHSQKNYSSSKNRQSFYHPFLKSSKYQPIQQNYPKNNGSFTLSPSPKKYQTSQQIVSNSMSMELPPILPAYKNSDNRRNIFKQNDNSLSLSSEDNKHLKKIFRYAQQKPQYAPLLPAYRQSKSLNNKIKEMKKQYKQFQNFLTKGKKLNRNTQNPENNEDRLWDSLKLEVNKQKQQNYPLQKRRTFWLNEDQNNLIKHTQMDYVFQKQIQDDDYPRKRKLKDSIVPKSINFMSNPIEIESKLYDPTQIFRSRHRMEAHLSEMPKFSKQSKRRMDNDEENQSQAMKRRQFAKINIARRRQKLGYLLRTSW